jgi:hypothetical protein
MYKKIIIGAILFVAGCGKVFSPLNTSQPSEKITRYPGLVDDFEGGTSVNNFGQENQAETDNFVNDPLIPNTPPGPSTMTVLNAPGSTLPGGTPGNALRLMGTVLANVGWNQPGPGNTYTSNNFPFAFFEMNINYPGGINITSMAPKRQLYFSYKASAGDIGQVHRVTIMNTNIATPLNYEFYICTFSPTNTNWTPQVINFPPQAFTSNPCLGPNSSGSQPNYFWPAIFYGTCSGGGGLPAWVSWDYVQTHTTAILFQPFNGSTPFTYDFSIDDVRFQ